MERQGTIVSLQGMTLDLREISAITEIYGQTTPYKRFGVYLKAGSSLFFSASDKDSQDDHKQLQNIFTALAGRNSFEPEFIRVS